MGRGRFLPMMIAACMVAGTAGAAGADTREEFRAAMRQARDGDLQADWSKMLDARERFAGFTANEELSALAHYYLGYTDWRLSALAFVATGPAASGRLAERAVASLEVAIQKRPQFLDAHALLVTCLATWLYADPSLREAILPRIQKAWDAALPGVASNPRVMLLRAMGLTVAPPPFGNREEGLELWRKAIQAFETDRPEPLMPDWGRVEAIAWLGGAHRRPIDTEKPLSCWSVPWPCGRTSGGPRRPRSLSPGGRSRRSKRIVPREKTSKTQPV